MLSEKELHSLCRKIIGITDNERINADVVDQRADALIGRFRALIHQSPKWQQYGPAIQAASSANERYQLISRYIPEVVLCEFYAQTVQSAKSVLEKHFNFQAIDAASVLPVKSEILSYFHTYGPATLSAVDVLKMKANATRADLPDVPQPENEKVKNSQTSPSNEFGKKSLNALKAAGNQINKGFWTTMHYANVIGSQVAPPLMAAGKKLAPGVNLPTVIAGTAATAAQTAQLLGYRLAQEVCSTGYLGDSCKIDPQDDMLGYVTLGSAALTSGLFAFNLWKHYAPADNLEIPALPDEILALTEVPATADQYNKKP